MNKNQEDTLNMYQATSQVLESNNSVWTGNVPFTTSVKQLNVNIDQIVSLQEQQIADTTGVTAGKQAQRAALEMQLYHVASIIVFYAADTKNVQLRLSVQVTRSDLSRARDNELSSITSNIIQAATDNQASLMVYGLTASDIPDLTTALDAYQDVMSKPRDSKAETASATNQMPPLFSSTSELLENILDRGMELYDISDEDFYNQYFIARMIMNSATRVLALDVTVTDGTDPLPRALVSIDDKTINRRTTDKGIVRVQNLMEGLHTMTVTLPGYATQTISFNVVQSETTKLNVTMVAVK